MHTDIISITFAYIPVLLAGAVLGVPDAVIVGAVFGLASMWKAGANYVLPADQMFSPFMSGRPVESIVLSIGARMMFGLVTGFFVFPCKAYALCVDRSCRCFLFRKDDTFRYGLRLHGAAVPGGGI